MLEKEREIYKSSLWVANQAELTLQLETAEEMEKPATSAEDTKENPTETSPSNTNEVTKNKTKGQGESKRETLQNDKDVMSQVRLIEAVCLPANHLQLATVPVQVTHVKGTVLLEPWVIGPIIKVKECLLEVKENSSTGVVIVNNSNSSCQL